MQDIFYNNRRERLAFICGMFEGSYESGCLSKKQDAFEIFLIDMVDAFGEKEHLAHNDEIIEKLQIDDNGEIHKELDEYDIWEEYENYIDEWLKIESRRR